MPPRHGKSQPCSEFYPAWFLGVNPEKRVILASYEASFAASWGRKSRDVLTEFGRLVAVPYSSKWFLYGTKWLEIRGEGP